MTKPTKPLANAPKKSPKITKLKKAKNARKLKI